MRYLDEPIFTGACSTNNPNMSRVCRGPDAFWKCLAVAITVNHIAQVFGKKDAKRTGGLFDVLPFKIYFALPGLYFDRNRCSIIDE